MSVLSIIKPNPVISASGGSFTGAARVLTANPKEAAFTATSGNHTLYVDLGSVQTVDTMFLGYCNGGTPLIDLSYSVDGISSTVIQSELAPAAKLLDNSNRHYFLRFAPVSGRYFYWSADDIPAGFSVGIAAVGQPGFAFNPTYGHEWGSGRGIIDTGSATRLQSGAFGIDEGVTAGSWSFTLGDLTDAEVDYLYELLKSVGLRGTMLVVEDTDLPNAGHNAIHWSIFQRLDVYERLSKQRTRWALRVEEWA